MASHITNFNLESGPLQQQLEDDGEQRKRALREAFIPEIRAVPADLETPAGLLPSGHSAFMGKYFVYLKHD